MNNSFGNPAIVWFRQDLRLGDNPGLAAAVATGAPIVPVYVLDDDNAGAWAIGAASRWWLDRSLRSLNERLGGSLRCLRGRGDEIIPALARELKADTVYVNRSIEPWQRQVDARTEAALGADSIVFKQFAASTLFDPASVLKPDGEPYRVFTPFYRKGCLQRQEPPREPLAPPSDINTLLAAAAHAVDRLSLLPAGDWYSSIDSAWSVGETAALDRLDRFLDQGLAGYSDGRNRPDLQHVSRLSPHLHFGEISPNQVWYAVLGQMADPALESDADTFLSELGWREFSNYLLWHWPSLPEDNLQSKFDRFPWQTDSSLLEKWQRGQTGYPIVDAGMRELWQTGYMHNRVRMIVGSFLVKNLLLDWRHGERWFWDTLVDADLANNSASWQWVAGSGADAAPYFRIFNPVTQGQRFDPEGSYVRHYIPELAGLETREIHCPWKAAASERVGLDYPDPIVDLKESRERALTAFRSLAGSA